MKVRVTSLNKISRNLFEQLYPETLIHSFGRLTKEQKGKKRVAMISANFVKAHSNDATFFQETLPIEELTLIRRGDIYNKSGAYIKKNDKRCQPRTLKFILTADNKPKHIDELVPRTKNPKYQNLSDAFSNQWAMQIDAIDVCGKQVNVIVPCTAIASFYLPHSCLLRAALSGGGLGADSVLVNKRLTEEGRKMLSGDGIEYVHLHKKIYDVVAPHVARIYLSEVAKRAFNSIHEYSFRFPFSNGNYGLYCQPFVDGTLTWEVLGQQSAPHEPFIVSQISSCNGSFPFSDLIFGRENDNRGEPGEETKPLEKKKKANELPNTQEDNERDDNDNDGEDEDDKLIENTGLADDDIESVHILVDSKDAMCSQLANLNIRKIEKVTCKVKTIPIYIGNAIIQALAYLSEKLGANNTQKLLAKLDAGRISTVHASDINDNPDCDAGLRSPFLAEIYNYLSDIELELPSAAVTFRHIKPKCDSYHSLSKYENVMPPEYRDLGGKGNWVMLRNIKKSKVGKETLTDQVKRCRKFIIAQVLYKETYSYLVEFEQDEKENIAGLFFSNFQEKLTPDRLTNVITTFVENRRLWRTKTTMPYAHKLVHKLEKVNEKDEKCKKHMYLEKIANSIKALVSTPSSLN